jgi:hemoglobin/transferrin/lactoferrin receptor protein
MKAGAVDVFAQDIRPQSAAPPSAAVTLDPVTIVATKTRERVSETLAPVSTVRSAPAPARPAPAPPAPPRAVPVASGPVEALPPSWLRATADVGPSQLQQLMPSRVADIFFGTPGVWIQERPDDPGTAINIRGLQDFGRVNTD